MEPVRYVDLGVVITPERAGVWCPPCALPSAVEYLVLTYDYETLRLYRSDRTVVCTECGTQTPVVPPHR